MRKTNNRSHKIGLAIIQRLVLPMIFLTEMALRRLEGSPWKVAQLLCFYRVNEHVFMV